MSEIETATVEQEIEKSMKEFRLLSVESQQWVRLGIVIGVDIATRVQAQKVSQ